jgi:hypothetical protein
MTAAAAAAQGLGRHDNRADRSGARADVGLLRVAHKTVTLVQPRAFPFAMRRAQDGSA